MFDFSFNSSNELCHKIFVYPKILSMKNKVHKYTSKFLNPKVLIFHDEIVKILLTNH